MWFLFLTFGWQISSCSTQDFQTEVWFTYLPFWRCCRASRSHAGKRGACPRTDWGRQQWAHYFTNNKLLLWPVLWGSKRYDGRVEQGGWSRLGRKRKVFPGQWHTLEMTRIRWTDLGGGGKSCFRAERNLRYHLVPTYSYLLQVRRLRAGIGRTCLSEVTQPLAPGLEAQTQCGFLSD